MQPDTPSTSTQTGLVPAIQHKYFAPLTVTDHYNTCTIRAGVSGHTAGANGGDQSLVLPAEVELRIKCGPAWITFGDLSPDMARRLAADLIGAAAFAEAGPALNSLPLAA